MVEQVTNSRDAYIQQRIAQMPDVKKGGTHVIKYGDTLWDIAKSHLHKGAKRGEINDYVLSVAKLNGYKTAAEMNNIKLNTTIFLPAEETQLQTQTTSTKSQKVVSQQKTSTTQEKAASASKANNNVSSKKGVQTQADKKITSPTVTVVGKNIETSAQKCFKDRVNTVLNDSTVTIKDAYMLMYLTKNKLYHVHHEATYRSGYKTNSSPVMSFIMQPNGHICDISYEDDNNIYKYGYDYNVNKNNVIESTRNPNKTYGKVEPSLVEKLEQKLQSLINRR